MYSFTLEVFDRWWLLSQKQDFIDLKRVDLLNLHKQKQEGYKIKEKEIEGMFHAKSLWSKN